MMIIFVIHTCHNYISCYPNAWWCMNHSFSNVCPGPSPWAFHPGTIGSIVVVAIIPAALRTWAMASLGSGKSKKWGTFMGYPMISHDKSKTDGKMERGHQTSIFPSSIKTKLHRHRPQIEKVSETLLYVVRIRCCNSGIAGSQTLEPMSQS